MQPLHLRLLELKSRSGLHRYMHTQECREELTAWVEAKLGPAVCKARQKACEGAV